MEEFMTQQNPKQAEPEEHASWKQLFIVLGAAAVVILLDQGSKLLVEAAIPFNTSWAPLAWLAPVFQFTHTGNTGMAFGLFPGGSLIFLLIPLLVSGVILYYSYLLPPGSTAVRVILGVMMGGALGNLIDRVRIGHVTDFLDFGPWYIFNIADAAVVFGAIALAIMMWLEERQLKAQQEAAQENISRLDERDEQPAS
jgi:signal peptidase II